MGKVYTVTSALSSQATVEGDYSNEGTILEHQRDSVVRE